MAVYKPSEIGLIAKYPFDLSNSNYDKIFDAQTPIISDTRAMTFNGTDDFVTILDDPVFNLTTQISASAWINKNDLTGTEVIISKYNTDAVNKREWRFIVAAQKLNVNFGDPADGTFEGTWASNNDIINPIETWQHIVFTYDIGTVILYLNGVAVAGSVDSGAIPVTLYNDDADIIIGASNAGIIHFFSGNISDARIYDVTLTAPQVLSLYNTGNTPYPIDRDNLLGHWKLDKYTHDEVTIEDFSENGNDGTSNNNPIFGPGRFPEFYNAISLNKLVFNSADDAIVFDGTTDKIDVGSDIIGTGDISMSTWIYPTGWGEGGSGRILDNGNFMIWINGAADKLGVSSDNLGTIIWTANNSIVLNTLTNVILTRTSPGVVNIYINNVLSGGADQDSGTPAIGTTNVIIGNNDAEDRTFAGQISNVRIFNRILSTDEIQSIYYEEIQIPGLVAHWLLNDDAANTNVVESVGTNTATFNDAGGDPNTDAHTVTGPSSTALIFDGIDDFAKKTVSNFRSADSTGSISVWIKVRVGGSGDRMIFSSADEVVSARYWDLQIESAGNRIQIKKRGDGTIETSTFTGDMEDDLWHHIVITGEGIDFICYIDGVVSALDAGTNDGEWLDTISSRDNVVIGAKEDGGGLEKFFDGDIADLQIYSRILNPSEVLYLYRESAPT